MRKPPSEDLPAHPEEGLPNEVEFDSQKLGELMGTFETFKGPMLGMLLRHVDKDYLKESQRQKGLQDQRHHVHSMTVMVVGGVGFLVIVGFLIFLISSLAGRNPELLTELIRLFVTFIGGGGFGTLATLFVQSRLRSKDD